MNFLISISIIFCLSLSTFGPSISVINEEMEDLCCWEITSEAESESETENENDEEPIKTKKSESWAYVVGLQDKNEKHLDYLAGSKYLHYEELTSPPPELD